eukprot:5364999-Alexandrium_andersonii.AAC.1
MSGNLARYSQAWERDRCKFLWKPLVWAPGAWELVQGMFNSEWGRNASASKPRALHNPLVRAQ